MKNASSSLFQWNCVVPHLHYRVTYDKIRALTGPSLPESTAAAMRMK